VASNCKELLPPRASFGRFRQHLSSVAMLRTMLLLLAFALLGQTLAEEEEKCAGEPSKVEPTADLHTSTLTQGIFWFSLVYILLFWAFGGFLRSQWTKDTKFYCPEGEHIEGLCGLRGSGAGFRIPSPLFPRKVLHSHYSHCSGYSHSFTHSLTHYSHSMR
jgi:hypothetical protein